jgi:hypothetical protein
MSKFIDKHIKLVEAVNNSKTESEHYANNRQLKGFREALDIMKINQLMDCDWHYINQGIDRPMCCGVFLDWEAGDNEL